VDVDRNFVIWNADRLGKGKRIYLIAAYNFWRDLSAGLFLGKAFSNIFRSSTPRVRFVLTYDFLKALKRADIM